MAKLLLARTCVLACIIWIAWVAAPVHGEEASTAGLDAGLWPVPQMLVLAPGSVTVPATSFTVNVEANSTSARLSAAASRYQAIIRAAASAGNARGRAAAGVVVPSVTVWVRTTTSTLNMDTSYNYTLDITAEGSATVVGDTMYGCMYGLETLSQLVGAGGVIPFGSVTATDFPQFRHRGFMIGTLPAPSPLPRRGAMCRVPPRRVCACALRPGLSDPLRSPPLLASPDTGRRFWPVDLIKSTLDGMSYTKVPVRACGGFIVGLRACHGVNWVFLLAARVARIAAQMNVLHWHASDFCRFSIESKVRGPSVWCGSCRLTHVPTHCCSWLFSCTQS